MNNVNTNSFRFIHTADLHLDSPLKSLALCDPEIADLIGGATRSALINLVQLCLDEQVDALTIGGDLYDGELKSMKTAVFLCDQLKKLTDAGIKVFIIKGNHDCKSRITTALTPPDGVHIFSGHAGIKEMECGNIAIHGMSFSHYLSPESLLPKYKNPIAGKINIGLMHTSLDGAEGHDRYSPCSSADLLNHGYDFWCLGHIHKRNIVEQNDKVLLMPGIPQGRHINESGAMSVTLVTIPQNGNIELEEKHIHKAQFERINVNIQDISEWQDVIKAVENKLNLCYKNTKSEYLVGRIELRGQTPLAYNLNRDADRLIHEIRKIHSCIFIEKIVLNQNIFQKPNLNALDIDPISELSSLMIEMNLNDPAFLKMAKEELNTVRKFLPSELRNEFGKCEDSENEIIENLISEGCRDVLSELERQNQGEC